MVEQGGSPRIWGQNTRPYYWLSGSRCLSPSLTCPPQPETYFFKPCSISLFHHFSITPSNDKYVSGLVQWWSSSSWSSHLSVALPEDQALKTGAFWDSFISCNHYRSCGSPENICACDLSLSVVSPGDSCSFISVTGRQPWLQTVLGRSLFFALMLMINPSCHHL